MTWRDRAQHSIWSVIGSREPKRMSEAERDALRDEISAAYPFGPRSCFPYKIWCEEVRSALGTKKPKLEALDPTDLPGQLLLFQHGDFPRVGP